MMSIIVAPHWQMPSFSYAKFRLGVGVLLAKLPLACLAAKVIGAALPNQR
jgi:hypothetical protein